MENTPKHHRLQGFYPNSSTAGTPEVLKEVIAFNLPPLADHTELLTTTMQYLKLLGPQAPSKSLSQIRQICISALGAMHYSRQIEDFISSLKGIKIYMEHFGIDNVENLNSIMNMQKERFAEEFFDEDGPLEQTQRRPKKKGKK